MGAQELTRKILADARERAAKLESEGRAAADAIRAKARDEQARLSAESRRQQEADVAPIIERARSSARLERRKRLLAARWRVIDQVVEQAGMAVVADRSYPDMLVALARRHSVPGTTVHFSEADTKLVQERGVKPGDPVAIKGGMLVRQGRMVLLLSLDESLSEIRDGLASELAKALFPE